MRSVLGMIGSICVITLIMTTCTVRTLNYIAEVEPIIPNDCILSRCGLDGGPTVENDLKTMIDEIAKHSTRDLSKSVNQR